MVCKGIDYSILYIDSCILYVLCLCIMYEIIYVYLQTNNTWYLLDVKFYNEIYDNEIFHMVIL